MLKNSLLALNFLGSFFPEGLTILKIKSQFSDEYILQDSQPDLWANLR